MAADRALLQAAFDDAMAQLRGLQHRFVIEYLKDGRGRDAAIRAGYSERTATVKASQLLTIVNLKHAIDLGRQLAALDAVADAHEILQLLTRQMRGSLADFLHLGEETVTITTWEEVDAPDADDEDEDEGDSPPDPAARRRILKRIETVQRPAQHLDLRQAAARGQLPLIREFRDTKDGITIKLYDAQKAAQLLGQAQGLFKDDGGILKYLDLAKLTPAQLQRLANGEDPFAVLLTTTPDSGASAA